MTNFAILKGHKLVKLEHKARLGSASQTLILKGGLVLGLTDFDVAYFLLSE
jgi:hypothetical protein